MDFLLLALVWFYVTGSFVVVHVARAKRLSGGSWWVLSLVVSPFVALIALAAMPASTAEPTPSIARG